MLFSEYKCEYQISTKFVTRMGRCNPWFTIPIAKRYANVQNKTPAVLYDLVKEEKVEDHHTVLCDKYIILEVWTEIPCKVKITWIPSFQFFRQC